MVKLLNCWKVSITEEENQWYPGIMMNERIKIKNGDLPDEPGVYFYYDRAGSLLYVGKATSLKRRVGSYFVKAHNGRIAEMVGKIARIDYIETRTVIEALILEANEIKARRPKYNILQRDDKTFLYLAITNERYPRPLLVRGHELKQAGEKQGTVNRKQGLGNRIGKGRRFVRIFGPYTSSRSLKIALELVRRSIPWSTCAPPSLGGRARPCFDSQIGKCPGVCIGAISQSDYRRVIRQLIMFFDGKKSSVERSLKREMERASRDQRFEDAALLCKRLQALKHIHDIALISREDYELLFTRTISGINLLGRIEAYDISNISGTSAVGSMVVFEDGKPAKHLYRRFKIKTVKDANDVAMLEEVVRRRIARGRWGKSDKGDRGNKGDGGNREQGTGNSEQGTGNSEQGTGASGRWEYPEVMIVDGGEPQVNRVQAVLDEFGIKIPIVGIAKGFDRKQDRLVYDRDDLELQRVITRGKELFQRARDEAHRFAIQYHRALRAKHFKRKKTL
jgi:excinuclease ABC subunit C